MDEKAPGADPLGIKACDEVHGVHLCKTCSSEYLCDGRACDKASAAASIQRFQTQNLVVVKIVRNSWRARV